MAIVGGAAALFVAEGRVAARAIGAPLGDVAPDADGVYNPERGDPIRLLMVGDSLAASLGAATASETVGALLARGLSQHTNRAVELRTVAVVGAETTHVPGQLDTLPLDYAADIAVVVVGGNDIIQRVPVAASARTLQGVLQRLRASHCEVVVGTCPDFDTVRPLPVPLREVGGQLSRRLAEAQHRAAVAAGARPVSLGKLLHQPFWDNPAVMFAIDGFHPSSMGYERASAALLPAVLDAFDFGGVFDTAADD